ncbi:MAG: toxin TcdB middle/C-terminal domain-containing protein [Gemmatimonadales bacterium]
MPADLLGNGTVCLVWSSPLPGDAQRPMRYVNLMGGQKPHLLVKTVNNLGAETRVQYAPSTKFYLEDKRDGKPWVTRLPFPVHVVERVETYDHISRNRFVTRSVYHHGYFDGEEREFRGFGMVEQLDTEELAALTGDGTLPEATNLEAASHVPPVHTKTWFHTGVYSGRGHVSDFFAGRLDATDAGEYYREPGLTPAQARALLLDDTVPPDDLTLDEEREASRSLKGAMLRQEVYALDGTEKAEHPYTVTEHNFTIRQLQTREGNRHAVFFTHPREAITYHYERNPDDPRVQHALTLDVDDFGTVLKEAAIGYGRRRPDAALPLEADRDKQTRTLVTYTENDVTNGLNDVTVHPDDHRSPQPSQSRTYELTGLKPDGNAARFSFAEWRDGSGLAASATEIPYEQTADDASKQKRLIEHVRTLYRPNDLGAARNDPSALLPLGELESLALAGESYQLAFTPGLLAQVFRRDGQLLLPDPAEVLGGQGADRGGYVVSQDLKAAGDFPDSDQDDHWWIPSGRVFLSPDRAHTPAQELAHAQRHFFLPHRSRDPFGSDTVMQYDGPADATQPRFNLLITRTTDVLGNTVTAAHDYRVLQPRLVTDPNRNRTSAAFDALGMLVGTAVMGKPLPSPPEGDSLDGFSPDLAETEALGHLANPLVDPHSVLGSATTRLVHDLFAYQRTKDQPDPEPAVVYTLARETHDADLEPGQQTRIQHSFGYSDGYGREIQKKIQAEPEKINGVAGPPRWVGSGWTIFNNKGKPVRQYEPFFSATHRFELGVQVGVSPILFYDPVERVVATLHPNHTYDKVIFDPWKQTTYDVNDTVLGDPRTDADTHGYVAAYFEGLAADPAALPWQTWHAQRQGGALGVQEQAAAGKAAAHADTPSTAHADTLGRPFLSVAHNKVVSANHDLDDTEDKFRTRVELDIEGNERAVRDALRETLDPQGNTVIDELGRVVMRYAYDMLVDCRFG